MKCDKCKNACGVQPTLFDPDGDVYCAAGHWHGIEYAISKMTVDEIKKEQGIEFDPYKDCADFFPSKVYVEYRFRMIRIIIFDRFRFNVFKLAFLSAIGGLFLAVIVIAALISGASFEQVDPMIWTGSVLVAIAWILNPRQQFYITKTRHTK